MNAGSLSFLGRLDRMACAVSKVGILFSGGCIALITLMIFVNVVARSLFDLNMPFVEEWAALAMVPMSYLGLGYTLRKGKHISADIVISRVSERNKHLMLLFVSVFAFLVLLFFMERGWDLLSYNWTRNIATNGPMRTPLWLPAATILIGLLVFTVDVLFWIIHIVLRLLGKPGLQFIA